MNLYLPRPSLRNTIRLIVVIALIAISVIWIVQARSGNFDPAVAEEASKLPEEPNLEDPIPFGEQVSTIADVQSRLPYTIPLPSSLEGEWSPTSIWVSALNVPNEDRQLFIAFGNGVKLNVYTASEAPPLEAITSQPNSPFTLIEVAGHKGLGADPGRAEIHGQVLEEPGSVGWWQEGLKITLYHDTWPMEKLLEVAPLFAR